MERSTAHISGLQTLAAQWRVLGVMAVAFARLIAGMGKASPSAALKRAEQLELWLVAAIAMLARQIDMHAPKQSRIGASEIERLQATALALLSLLLFIQRVKRRLGNTLQNSHALQGSVQPRRTRFAAQAAHDGGFAYFDTS